MKIKNNRGLVLSIFIFINFFFSISISANETTKEITEKELCVLANLCYYNKVNKNVKSMIEINNKSMIASDEIDSWKNWEVVDYIINDNSKCFGFSCFTFKRGPDIVIAARGTDGGILYENWRYFIPRHEHPQAQYMKLYVHHLFEENIINSKTNIYLTGHSLGGYLSLYGAGILLQIEELKKCFIKVVTFNGLGLGSYTNSFILKELYELEPQKIVNYRIQGDLVSYIGTHITPVITLQPIKLASGKSPSVHSMVQFLNQGLPILEQEKLPA